MGPCLSLEPVAQTDQTVRIFNSCEVGIVNSIMRITVQHHEAS